MPRDYYRVLGVDRAASEDEIRRAYRALARKHHPDVSKEEGAEERFQEISEAYEVLSDKEKRAAYDRFGHTGVGAAAGTAGGWPGGTAGGNVDLGDLFDQVFGGGASPFGGGGGPRTARPRGPVRGEDVPHALTVTFMTAALGGEEAIRMTGGSRITVKIPAGIESGAKLRVKGKGKPSPDGSGTAGDLIVTVNVGGHPWFRREGLDILMDVPVTIAEASLGTTVSVPLLRGSADIRVPAGASSGQRLRVRGRGIVDPKGVEGDFYAIIQIVAPDSLSDDAQERLRQIAAELKNPRETGPWADNG